ncbi:MAG: MarR family transcriptional regulator [Nanoarchaeota archaeon]
MGQHEVMDFLVKNKSKWFTSKEIAEGLKCSIGSVTTCLAKLRKTNYIEYKEPSDKRNYFYRIR